MPRPTPIIRKVLVTAAVLLAALAGGLVYVVQPIGWRSSGARPDGVDPVRLEAHVRMLAETLAPRHWKRQDNLDRAAAYVAARLGEAGARVTEQVYAEEAAGREDRKSTRLNSSHSQISYAVFCLKKKTPSDGECTDGDRAKKQH